MSTIARMTWNSRGRLLVVEDELVHRSIIGKIAAKLGYDAVTASTFEVAAGLLRRERYDAMTLDLSLGEHDGIELLRLVSQCGFHDMPIVIISGCDERILNSTRRVAESLGLALVSSLTKPLNIDSLKLALSLPPAAAHSVRDRAAIPDISRELIMAGLERREFSVEFQPKIELASGKVTGAEALARWRSTELGAVSPADFIPAAERLGLMRELTDHILATTFKQGRALAKQHPGFTIAVNLSGSMMGDLTIPDRIEAMLHAENLRPDSLIVEVTESVAMSDIDRAMDILVRLRIKGIGAAIDDFGTGYSSLAALARLPFSELKIDQSFVRGCESDEDLMKIVKASMGLGRAFRMKVVAEGIDNEQTLACVREAGCDIGQGYLFAPPLASDRVEGWLMRYRMHHEARLAPVDVHPSKPAAIAANRGR